MDKTVGQKLKKVRKSCGLTLEQITQFLKKQTGVAGGSRTIESVFFLCHSYNYKHFHSLSSGY